MEGQRGRGQTHRVMGCWGWCWRVRRREDGARQALIVCLGASVGTSGCWGAADGCSGGQGHRAQPRRSNPASGAGKLSRSDTASRAAGAGHGPRFPLIEWLKLLQFHLPPPSLVQASLSLPLLAPLPYARRLCLSSAAPRFCPECIAARGVTLFQCSLPLSNLTRHTSRPLC